VPTVEQAEQLYGRLIDPRAWTPYPDCEAVLNLLAAQGVSVGVVSNIAFDLRPAFVARGWDPLIQAYALSFEVGAIKPDPAIFRGVLEKLDRAGGGIDGWRQCRGGRRGDHPRLPLRAGGPPAD
jgi:HAD superfamily hydrolase (TIGR01493 family)